MTKKRNISQKITAYYDENAPKILRFPLKHCYKDVMAFQSIALDLKQTI